MGKDIRFEQLFNVEDIQRIQDQFARATQVASIITYPDGTPITRPSRFTSFCQDIVRQTEKGRANCFKSDASLGRLNLKGPVIKPCMSAGLWDAGAGIAVDGHHIANWLIGQVRDASQTEDRIRAYARQIHADEEQAVQAFLKVPSMSRETFGHIADFLHTMANQLSSAAYQNLQKTRMIADMQATEEKLRESEGKYRDIFNAGHDIILMIDDETGRILDINEAVSPVFGYERREVIGGTIGQFSAGGKGFSQERALEKIGQVKAAGSQVFEWQCRRKNGELFWTEVSLKYSSVSRDKKIIAVVRDISARKQTQEIMIQTEKMMSVGGLAAGMAHEINNPLAGILQNMSVLGNRLTNPEIPANQAAAREAGTTMAALGGYVEKRGIPRILEGITNSAVRVAGIVENMLNFARKSDASFSSHDPKEIVERALELASTDYDLKKHFDFRSIHIERQFDPDLPLIPCEGSKIQQVLLNILNNGAYAMHQANGDTPSKFIIRLKKEAAGTMVRMEIEDTGPGMDDATQKKIFEPFFTTKPVGEGTGLGLSVSYFIITDNHKGTLTVRSRPGCGTVFIIRLPVG